MANHNYTSLTELLDVPQTSPPPVPSSFVSDHGSSDDHSFPIEMFGELYFSERSSSSIWDLFNPPLPPPRHLPQLPLHDQGLILKEGTTSAAAGDDGDIGKQNKSGTEGFVRKIIFLPHEIMAAASSSGGGGRLRMPCPRDFAAADDDEEEEEEREKSSDEVSENVVKPGNKPRV